MQILNAMDPRGHKHYTQATHRRKGVMLHRGGVDDRYKGFIGYSAAEIGAAFRGGVPEAAKYTGNKEPYAFIIGGDRGPAEYDGVIWQCLPLDVVGPHAQWASKFYISILCVGDFRYKPMSAKQRASLLWLAPRIQVAIDGFKFVGHGEVRGSHDGSKAPDGSNACPGLSQRGLDRLRVDVVEARKSWGLSELDIP